MPSGEIVEIDLADNDVAILDSTACALTTAAASASSDGKTTVVSQSQGETANDDQEEAAVRHQVSPMPKRSTVANTITPRSMRKKAPSKVGKGRKASTKKKGTNDTSTSSGPSTPPPSAAVPRTSEAAVATPGDDSATKKNKNDKAVESENKPVRTMHSFFAKADPSVKKKTTTTKVVVKAKTSGESDNGGKGAAKTISKAKTSTAPTAANKKKTKTSTVEAPISAVEEPAVNETVIAENSAQAESEEPAAEVDETKSSAKEPNVKATEKKQPPKKASKKTAKKTKVNPGGDTATVPKKATKKATKKRSVLEDLGELDDSPMYALAMAMKGRRRKSGGRKKPVVKDVAKTVSMEVVDVDENGAGTAIESKPVVFDCIVAAVGNATNGSNKAEVADIVELADVDESMHVADVHKEDASNGSTVTDVVDPAEPQADAMHVGQDMSDDVSDTPSNATDSNELVDVDCEKQSCAKEELTLGSGTNLDDNNDDDEATVEIEEFAEKSTVPTNVITEDSSEPVEVSADQEPAKDAEEEAGDALADMLVEKQAKEDEDEVIVVELSHVPDELLLEVTGETASNDEVALVDAPTDTKEKAIRPKKKPVKPRTKSGKKKPAAASTTTKSKKKTLSPALGSKTKKTSMIAASFKKLAACPPKKSKVSTTPIKTLTTSCSITVSSKSELKDVTPSASIKATKSDAAPSAKSKTKKVEVSATTTAPKAKLSEEDASRLRHYTTLREKYVTRATELGNRPTSDDFQEEKLSLESAEPTLEMGSVEVGEDGVFPDALLIHLQLLVQGRSMPLSSLSEQAYTQLSPFITASQSLTVESTSSKIKLLAQRKSYITGPAPAPSEKSTPTSKLDCFENAEDCYMWRWELSSIDFLPKDEIGKVKKARGMRKKLQSHYRSIMNLIAAVDKAMAWLNNGASKCGAGDKLIAKVSDMEEKVLKFEREEEKNRLIKEAKLLKQKAKTGELAGKLHEKEQLEEERKADKKRKEEEKNLKKAEAAKEREEARRKKIEEKEQKELKKRIELEEKENKRKKRMMSFFSMGSAKKKQKVTSSPGAGASLSKSSPRKVNVSSFDVDAFRKALDEDNAHIPTNPFTKLYPSSKASRRCKIGKVRISVFVTVLSENAFAPQPYDEERIITVPNRYKFLGFHEDIRPPYRGTWSKTSKLVTGRRPWGKDISHLDYENDSEGEWEEGDDDEGEDLQEDGDDGVDEEGDDLQNEEDNDGFIADEDDLGIDDDDDMTRELRKKNLTETDAPSAKRGHFKACVVAPCMGGAGHQTIEDMACVIEGFSPHDAMDVLTSHVGCVVSPDVSICLDAFPPSESPKDIHQTKKETSTAQNKEMTTDAQNSMAKFVHNCALKSKENLVTELLKAHPTITNSRAHAMRELDVIAEKRRLANGAGVLWEVKAAHLKKLGLKKKELKKPPKESLPSDGGDKTKKEKDPNAPKRNMSAFLLYSNATRTNVRVENPNATFGDIAKILSKKFKSLTPEDRTHWDGKAAADKERYHHQMVEYSSNKVVAAVVSDTAVASTSSPIPPNTDAQQSRKSSSAKKRKKSAVSTASANLFASFLTKSKKPKTA